MLGSALRPSWPVKLALNVDAMTLGGATVQNVGSDLRSDGTTWTVDGWSFARPASPRSRSTAGSIRWARGSALPAAPASIPTIRRIWWRGSPAAPIAAAQFKPWRAKGDVTLAGGPHRGRAAAHRDRSRRGRGQPVLRLAGRRPAGAPRWRTARGRARSRRRARLWQVRAVRPGAGAAGRGRAGAGDRARQDRRLRRAQHRRASQARRQRARDRAAVGRRPGRHELRRHRPNPDAVVAGRQHHRQSRCARSERHPGADGKVRAGAAPVRCAGSRRARRPRRCKPASAWKAAAPMAPAARSA